MKLSLALDRFDLEFVLALRYLELLVERIAVLALGPSVARPDLPTIQAHLEIDASFERTEIVQGEAQ